MLKLLFENDSKEEALKMRDMICKALKDVPGFNTNECYALHTHDYC